MMLNVYLFQPQYSEFIKQKWRYWLPYSCGCLWSYAQQFDDIVTNWQLSEIFFKRDPLFDVVARIQDPAVCGFSCYLWNERYNLALAQEIKQRWPDCVIFFGGPQTSSDYLKHDFIDCIMMGEGEMSFVELLRNITAARSVPKFWPKTRITDLSTLPPVYTSGVFDHILESYPDALFNAVLETNRGCPFSCTFCDWGGLTYSKVKKFDEQKIEAEMAWLARSRVASMFLADANFGIFPQRDLELAQMIKRYADASPTIEYINVNFTKNSNENVYALASILMPYTKSVTISMQSMHEDTLDAIKRRNMKFNDLQAHLALSKKYDVPTYTELILGMPQETKESWKTGVTDLLEAGQRNQIDVFFSELLRNSEMSQPEYRRKYGIKSVIANNIMAISSGVDEDPALTEQSEIIYQTNTMSTADMIESYMYYWVIGNFDTAGYSQIVSKFCRHVLGVTYRDYYDRLFHMISTQETCVSPEYQDMCTAANDLLTKGRITNLDIGYNHLSFYHYVGLYSKKDKLVDLAIGAAKQFGDIPESFQELQRRFVFDQAQPDQYHIRLSHDMDTWQSADTNYIIRGRATSFEHTYFYLILQRKRGLMKNAIEKVPMQNACVQLDTDSIVL